MILLVTVNYDMLVFVFGLTIYSILLLFLNLYYCGKPIDYTLKEQLRDTMPIFIRLFVVVAVAMLAGYMVVYTSLALRVLISLLTGSVVNLLLFMTYPGFRMIMNLFVSILKRQ